MISLNIFQMKLNPKRMVGENLNALEQPLPGYGAENKYVIYEMHERPEVQPVEPGDGFGRLLQQMLFVVEHSRTDQKETQHGNKSNTLLNGQEIISE